MPLLLGRILRLLLLRRNLALPAVIIVTVFVTSWPLMWLAEPAGAKIVQPDTYWWWFLVTGSTVGYGDYFPTTTAGHLTGGYVIVGGIVSLTTLFSQLALLLDDVKGRRMNGSMVIEHSGHVVVLGYTPGRTERIVEELLADGAHRVALCAWEDVDHHPMPEHDVDFVRGDLTDGATLRRAGVDRARGVLIDARDDNESLTITLTVAHVASRVLAVVALRDLSRATHVRYVTDAARCVQWHNPRMLTEELQSPGISDVYTELMSHGGGNSYSMALPDAVWQRPFGDWQLALGKRYDATVIAARLPDGLRVGPAWSTPIPAGSVLYYVSQHRLTADEAVDAISNAGSPAPTPR